MLDPFRTRATDELDALWRARRFGYYLHARLDAVADLLDARGQHEAAAVVRMHGGARGCAALADVGDAAGRNAMRLCAAAALFLVRRDLEGDLTALDYVASAEIAAADETAPGVERVARRGIYELWRAIGPQAVGG